MQPRGSSRHAVSHISYISHISISHISVYQYQYSISMYRCSIAPHKIQSMCSTTISGHHFVGKAVAAQDGHSEHRQVLQRQRSDRQSQQNGDSRKNILCRFRRESSFGPSEFLAVSTSAQQQREGMTDTCEKLNLKVRIPVALMPVYRCNAVGTRLRFPRMSWLAGL
eukprot:SAG31_NODE_21270_length_553_cov_1.422907_1_plen_166_part_10